MRLGIINTGGTISCVGDPLAPMSAGDFADACTRIVDPIIAHAFPDVELEYLTDLTFPAFGLGTLDSTNLQPADWCVLAERILLDYSRFDGWVVLHGTDSMAYTASALPFLLSSFGASGDGTAVLSKPVVLTGSQVPLFSQNGKRDELTLRFSTDAYQNFCSAIAFARAGVPEVTVAFNGSLLRGNRVLKTSTDMNNAFTSPNFPALGSHGINLALETKLLLPGPADGSVSLDSDKVRTRALERLRFIAGQIDGIVVVPISAFPATFGTDGRPTLARLLDAVLSMGVQGIVLESYGEGNFPSGAVDPKMVGPIESVLVNAIADGVIVVNGTQVLSGAVDDQVYAAGAWLSRAGTLAPGDMTTITAFAKTTILLAEQGWSGNNWGKSTVSNLIRQSLAGEMRMSDKLVLGSHFELLPGQELVALDGSARLINDGCQGLRLVAADGQVLWHVSVLVDNAMPAILHLHSGGVALVERSGRQIWAMQVPMSSRAHKLVLSGSFIVGDLQLAICDWANKSLVTLYV